MSSIATDELLLIAEQAARLGASVLMDWRGRFNVSEKGPADLVTEADVASQRAISDYLASKAPDIEFLGEENTPNALTLSDVSDRGDLWVVDPLDGTTNYVHDLPGWCVSVGLVRNGQPMAGCVYDPISESCFTASTGNGAFCNGKRLGTSNTQSLSEALIAISLPAKVERGSWEVERLLDTLVAGQAFRRMGSAALNLCYLASGSLDGYWANSIKAWDVAGGLIVLSEAGGIASDLDGGKIDVFKPRLVAGANASIHRQLRNLLNPTGNVE